MWVPTAHGQKTKQNKTKTHYKSLVLSAVRTQRMTWPFTMIRHWFETLEHLVLKATFPWTHKHTHVQSVVLLSVSLCTCLADLNDCKQVNILYFWILKINRCLWHRSDSEWLSPSVKAKVLTSVALFVSCHLRYILHSSLFYVHPHPRPVFFCQLLIDSTPCGENSVWWWGKGKST